MKDLIPLLIVLLSFFWAYPILRILNAWVVDKTMDGRLALFAIAIHLTAIAALWHSGLYTYLLIYLSTITGLWLASPVIARIEGAYSMRRMRDEDMRRYLGILAKDPGNAAAHAALADIYLERGRFDEAVAGYQRAIDIAPDHSRRERLRLKYVTDLRDRRYRWGRKPAPPAELLFELPPGLPVDEAREETEVKQAVPDEAPSDAWQWYNGAD